MLRGWNFLQSLLRQSPKPEECDLPVACRLLPSDIENIILGYAYWHHNLALGLSYFLKSHYFPSCCFVKVNNYDTMKSNEQDLEQDLITCFGKWYDKSSRPHPYLYLIPNCRPDRKSLTLRMFLSLDFFIVDDQVGYVFWWKYGHFSELPWPGILEPLVFTFGKETFACSQWFKEFKRWNSESQAWENSSKILPQNLVAFDVKLF